MGNLVNHESVAHADQVWLLFWGVFVSPSEEGSRVAKVEKVEFRPRFIDFDMELGEPFATRFLSFV